MTSDPLTAVKPLIGQLMPLIPDFLRALGSGLELVPGWPTVAGVALSAGAALVERGEAAAGEFAALSADLQAMVKAGTEPTADQLASLQARSDAAHTTLQGAP